MHSAITASFQFSSSLIATLLTAKLCGWLLLFQFSSSLIATRGRGWDWLRWCCAFNSLRVLLQHGPTGSLNSNICCFQFSSSLIATTLIFFIIFAPSSLSILFESYCNNFKSVKIYLDDTPFNSLRVLLQLSYPTSKRSLCTKLSILFESYCNKELVLRVIINAIRLSILFESYCNRAEISPVRPTEKEEHLDI